MNKNVFKSANPSLPVPTMVNEAGGAAYKLTDEHALAQYVLTGCLNNTFYADAETQLDKTLELINKCSPEFVAKLAVYAREFGYMKDMPALLVASLTVERPGNAGLVYFKKTFPRVIDNVKMLRNFAQIIRSGKVGRKSFGSTVKKAIQTMLNGMGAGKLFAQSIGNDPSLADVIKMVHPKAKTPAMNNMFAYLLGKEFDAKLLPDNARAFEKFKKDSAGAPPEINFQFLSNIKMSADQWSQLAENMGWQTLRMNLNTLARNGVFELKGQTEKVAELLKDRESIVKAKVFPYQLLAAFMNAKDLPAKVTNALQDALEVATENVPELPGKVVVAVDISGSMSSPVTGHRAGGTTAVRCLDVASLMGASVVRKNDESVILPFHTNVVKVKLNARDSVMTNTQKLIALPGGGTNCAAALKHLNDNDMKADAIIFVSDNESWASMGRSALAYRYSGGTDMSAEWAAFKKRNPKAKMVCIDIQPYAHAQVQDSKDVLNVGGFNDRVFDIVSLFLKGQLDGQHWVDVISKVEL